MELKIKYLTPVFFLLGLTVLLIVSGLTTSCNPKKETSESTAFEGKTTGDTIVQAAPSEAQTTPPSENDPSPSEPVEYKAPTPKVCSPNFNKLSNPAKNRYIFYVSNFNPGEFKCWSDLESHGRELCGKTPCLIYYVDAPKVNTNTKPPHYIDMNSLKTHGIGQFERTEFNWEVKGSKIWGREGRVYIYYNTDNHLGG